MAKKVEEVSTTFELGSTIYFILYDKLQMGKIRAIRTITAYSSGKTPKPTVLVEGDSCDLGPVGTSYLIGPVSVRASAAFLTAQEALDNLAKLINKVEV